MAIKKKVSEQATKKVRKKKEVEYFTDEMLNNVFVFQPTLPVKFTSSGKAVMKTLNLK